MMFSVPLISTASQQFSVVLAQQNCQITIYQKRSNLYFDLTVNDISIVRTRMCRNGVRVIRQTYQGFIGDFMFVDTQKNDDPLYTGLGSRWLLIYLEASDL